MSLYKGPSLEVYAKIDSQLKEVGVELRDFFKVAMTLSYSERIALERERAQYKLELHPSKPVIYGPNPFFASGELLGEIIEFTDDALPDMDEPAEWIE